MGTTTDKLNAVLDSKEAIRQAIEYRGVDIPMDTTLAEYAEKIGEIPTGGTLTDEQALVFISECADGKRKIAKAVRSKYETITEEESGITEYSTFEELSNKISQIPIEVPLGSAMEQNGGVLPFYDVYNELVKASKQYTEYPYCCAMELNKWDYDNDHKVTLSGADAYLTSDGVYLRSSEVNGEYQFQDLDQPNTNRFVVYFFGSSPYQVPKSLPATSVFGLWCLKGTPLMNFNADFITLNRVNVYDGDLDVKEANDFKFSSISLNQKLRLPHIKSISGGSNIFYNNTNLREITLPNLTTISGGNTILISNAALREITLPNLTTISNVYLMFTNNSNLKKIAMPKLKKINTSTNTVINQNNSLIELWLPMLEEITGSTSLISQNDKLLYLELPKLHKCSLLFGYSPVCETLILGDGMRDGIAGDIRIYSGTYTYLTSLIVAKGFKAKLNLTGCNGLSREVLLDIINNLADLTGEASLNLIMGSTLLAKLKDADKAIATQKNWTLS
ncbi:MAG: hypothetical protein E7083_05635 [Bacteroidales bacterium]|nr:hypothetical protein [Bacteroidales bacterium]